MTQSISGLASGLDTTRSSSSSSHLEQQKVNLVAARKTTANVATLDVARHHHDGQLVQAGRDRAPAPHRLDVAHRDVVERRVASVSAGSGTLNGTLQFTVDLPRVGRFGAFGERAWRTGHDGGRRPGDPRRVRRRRARVRHVRVRQRTRRSGTHTIKVTQASTAASKLGDAALDASTTIAGGDTLTLERQRHRATRSTTSRPGRTRRPISRRRSRPRPTQRARPVNVSGRPGDQRAAHR